MMRRAGIKSDAGIISARGQETACYHGRTKIAPGIVVNPYEIARGNTVFNNARRRNVSPRRNKILVPCAARVDTGRRETPGGNKRAQ